MKTEDDTFRELSKPPYDVVSESIKAVNTKLRSQGIKVSWHDIFDTAESYKWTAREYVAERVKQPLHNWTEEELERELAEYERRKSF